MKFRIEHRKLSDLQVGLYFTGIGLIGFVLSYFTDNLLRLIPPCLFHSITGIPCPACGGTRTGILLSHFQIIDALVQSPLFFLIFIALAVWGINSIIGLLIRRNLVVELSNTERKAIRWIIILAIPMNWLYLIVTD
jgi:hypothetical protein